jgi:glycosyltransferase involved in cell wall biosynthesis
MRILHIIDSGGMYGAEAVLLELAAGQERLGHSAFIASIGTPGCSNKPLEVAAERRGLTVHRVRMANGPNPSGAWRLIQLARRERVDILHSHGYKPDILLGFVPCPLRRLPLVSTVHGFTSTGGLSLLALYRWLDLRALRRCDRVVLVHDGMTRGSGLDRLGDPRWRVIENGISNGAEIPPADDDPIVQFCRSGPVVGAVGRLSPEKGFHHLLVAFQRLVEAGSNARLIMLGEGPERRRLEQMAAKANLNARILLPGFADARRYLPLFDVFVLPSLTEGLPIALLEAMHAGVPIVASRTGGVPAVLEGGGCGILVQPGDVSDLSAALEGILADGPRAVALAGRARLAVRERYSSARMAEQYLELYSELIDRQLSESGAPQHAERPVSPASFQ